jgi:hypothetical protein
MSSLVNTTKLSLSIEATSLIRPLVNATKLSLSIEDTPLIRPFFITKGMAFYKKRN